jgi:hypothetical protein
MLAVPTTPNTTRSSNTSGSLPSPKALSKGEQVIELAVAAPDPTKVPKESDILGVTVLMITALYRRQEFFRCSYFIYNNYEDESLAEGDSGIQIDQVTRSILVDKPRLRVYEIIWDYASHVKMVPETVHKSMRKLGTANKGAKTREQKKPKISKKKNG